MVDHLPGSIYVWACGEKPSCQEEDLKTSDELIGYLILLVRRLVHAMLHTGPAYHSLLFARAIGARGL